MTENEAIKELETSIDLAKMCTQNFERKREIEAYKTAIQALSEIQAYRAIGTVEEIQQKMAELEQYRGMGSTPSQIYVRMGGYISELAKYAEIGTAEECREAVEKVKKYEKQYTNDMNNPLEPLKVSSALRSELIKLEYRKQNKPNDINILDYTIIAVLQKALGIDWGEEE